MQWPPFPASTGHLALAKNNPSSYFVSILCLMMRSMQRTLQQAVFPSYFKPRQGERPDLEPSLSTPLGKPPARARAARTHAPVSFFGRHTRHARCETCTRPYAAQSTVTTKKEG